MHTNVQQELPDPLRTVDQVVGFTFTRVEGHGSEIEKNGFLAAHDEAVGYVPRIRTDLLLEDADVGRVLGAISGANTEIKGQGFYWVWSYPDLVNG